MTRCGSAGLVSGPFDVNRIAYRRDYPKEVNAPLIAREKKVDVDVWRVAASRETAFQAMSHSNQTVWEYRIEVRRVPRPTGRNQKHVGVLEINSTSRISMILLE